MLHTINTLSEKLAKSLVSLLVVVFADVFGRYLLSMPIKGSNEIISILLAGAVCFCIPVVTYRSEHIKVALLDDYLPQKFQRFMAIISQVIMIIGMYGISIKLLVWTRRFAMRKQETIFLEIPMTWFTYVGLACCYLTIVLLLLKALHKK